MEIGAIVWSVIFLIIGMHILLSEKAGSKETMRGIFFKGKFANAIGTVFVLMGSIGLLVSLINALLN